MKLGCCGLDCDSCGAKIATENNDDVLREKVAKEWNELYGVSYLTKEHINCTGCTAEGVKFGHCNECHMRKCAMERNLTSCGDCKDYPCKEISELHKQVPIAKQNIASI